MKSRAKPVDLFSQPEEVFHREIWHCNINISIVEKKNYETPLTINTCLVYYKNDFEKWSLDFVVRSRLRRDTKGNVNKFRIQSVQKIKFLNYAQ